MTEHPRRPPIAAPTPPTAPAMSPRPPSPIRVDREQPEQALKPVLAAIESMNAVMRDQLVPAFVRMGQQLERIATALEAAELRATRSERSRR